MIFVLPRPFGPQVRMKDPPEHDRSKLAKVYPSFARAIPVMSHYGVSNTKFNLQ